MARNQFTVAAADLGIADDPEIGGESRVFLSYDQIGYVGEINQPAPDSGVYKASLPANVFPLAGSDLALIVDKAGALSSADIVVTLNVTFADDTTGTAVATFTTPQVTKDTSHNLPLFLAVDVVGSAGNSAKKIKAVSGIASVTGGASGNNFQLVALPENWFDLGCARKKTPKLPVPKPLAIPCGLKANAFTKLGRSEVPELTIEALHFNYGDGLTRLNGHKGAVKVETWKAGRVLTERAIYCGVVFNGSPERGDGDDEATVTATCMFEDAAIFV